eukprot:CAMPEP_0202687340 /NCGR_PEP_ID=MMETSP1385-20130828/3028_1 /ASSEMBLY_ACC=CAM_ASM_000861 /TAXON_ID=933848 /ORGANISM="Elphidium margaritaceum" /LENGTH=1102 /DNA_ID=CAMNT_0049342113 /DNA_START=125 /DNA_END=3433 /DNA_ORIENTATION=-
MNISEKYNTLQTMYFISPDTDLNNVESPFEKNAKLVAKPDQLVKRRGKLGLVHLNKTFNECVDWVKTKINTKLTIESTTDSLRYFLIEPFVAHSQDEELYICIHSCREGDEILFYYAGGVDVGDVDQKAIRWVVTPSMEPTLKRDDFIANLLSQKVLPNAPFNDGKNRNYVQKDYHLFLGEFLFQLYRMYSHLHFAYLEINPLVVAKDLSGVYILDLAAKLDSCAEFVMHTEWSDIITEFPPFFGHDPKPEEAYIQSLDERTGSSLKLTVLNPNGRIWTLVAGGGASVIYADTICDLGFSAELGNYGEYSGAPTKDLTQKYAETVIKLLLNADYANKQSPPVLIIGGGIANFTDVAATFAGIIDALTTYRDELIAKKTLIYVRRGGPNYQRGLKLMREAGAKLGLEMQVFGPETHITAIVSMALVNKTPSENLNAINLEESINIQFEKQVFSWDTSAAEEKKQQQTNADDVDAAYVMGNGTRAIVYGLQTQAVQNMLDFDYICRRSRPSVAAIVYDFAAGDYHAQFYWGSKTIMIPVFRDLESALKLNEIDGGNDCIDTVVNFASQRSAFKATRDMILNFHSDIRHISIIAEGIPERLTKKLMFLARKYNVIILGPSTVGGIKAGKFRIGNTGGMLDNIVSSKLYRAGSVSFVSRSGGLSNELSNIISSQTDGVNEGMAIGGDRYPCTTFMDHLLRYQQEPTCKILVVLGEVGGTLEYDVIDAIKAKRLTKPIVAWCTGTCADYFSYDVQFGHAGALAQSLREKANAKNEALSKAGCFVPESFDDFGKIIRVIYNKLVSTGVINAAAVQKRNSIEPPPIPLDYHWARKLGMVRKASSFLSGISDERGDELVYAGVPISTVMKDDMGVGGVVGLLWFRRKLPPHFNKFIEMVLQITADHGPAVSGAHNTIVTARAGKDLLSSLCSGLLTIGPRFGGALDEAAKMFTRAYDEKVSPQQFVMDTRNAGKLIMGIGHKIKSVDNPDQRVVILKEFAFAKFPANSQKVLRYALEVEKVTTRKKNNLILNVDGVIACCFVDLLRSCKSFSVDETQQYIEMGTLNALFVLGRSIGFIGHYLDQKRLKQGLYRHPTDDITYFLSDINTNQ